jgi:hypothetical protein
VRQRPRRKARASDEERSPIRSLAAHEPLSVLGGGAGLEEILAVIAGHDQHAIGVAFEPRLEARHLAIEGAHGVVVERADLRDLRTFGPPRCPRNSAGKTSTILASPPSTTTAAARLFASMESKRWQEIHSPVSGAM